jgi:hypothetical protein
MRAHLIGGSYGRGEFAPTQSRFGRPQQAVYRMGLRVTIFVLQMRELNAISATISHPLCSPRCFVGSIYNLRVIRAHITNFANFALVERRARKEFQIEGRRLSGLKNEDSLGPGQLPNSCECWGPPKAIPTPRLTSDGNGK